MNGTNTQRTISFMCKLNRPNPGASALSLHQASHSPNPSPFWFPKLSSASLWVVSGHNSLQDLKILANVRWKCGCNRSKNTLSATRWAQDQSLPFFSQMEGSERLTIGTPVPHCHGANTMESSGFRAQRPHKQGEMPLHQVTSSSRYLKLYT